MEICYCCYAKDQDDLRKSSSGGLASSIAKYIIENQGVVYGVAYAQDYKSVEYIKATCDEDIKRLRGSKYIRARNYHIMENQGGYLKL